MSLKLRRFFVGTPRSIADINDFLSQPNLVIRHIFVAAHDANDDAIYIFYEEQTEPQDNHD